MNRIALLAALAALGLAGCNDPKAISAAAIQADAKAALVKFCATGLPEAEPFAGTLNGQMQSNYRTASRACADLDNGKSVNIVTAAIAALDLYDGLRATYPAAFKALAPADLRTLADASIQRASIARIR